MLNYYCKDNDVLDSIVSTHYGQNAVDAGAVEYVLSYNQNISRKEAHLTAGTIVKLPDLPTEISNSNIQTNSIRIFE